MADRAIIHPAQCDVLDPVSGSPRPLAFSSTSGLRQTRLSTVRLEAGGDVGTVVIQPGSRLRVVRTRPGDYRLALARGALPRPHLGVARAVRGRNLLRARLGPRLRVYAGSCTGRARAACRWCRGGWVSRAAPSEFSRPAGCELPASDTGARSGDPPISTMRLRRWWSSAPCLDASPGGASRAAAEAVVAAARPRDAFTLWHLLRRLDGARAALVDDRLAALRTSAQRGHARIGRSRRTVRRSSHGGIRWGSAAAACSGRGGRAQGL